MEAFQRMPKNLTAKTKQRLLIWVAQSNGYTLKARIKELEKELAQVKIERDTTLEELKLTKARQLNLIDEIERVKGVDAINLLERIKSLIFSNCRSRNEYEN